MFLNMRRPNALRHTTSPDSNVRLSGHREPSRAGRMIAMPPTVLVVDDDGDFRVLAARMLAALGLDVVGEAGTLDSAVAAASRLRPECVLVDVHLPDGNGIVLAERLASLPWRPRVVLTSSDPDVTNDAAVRRLGAVGFIAKDQLPTGALGTMLAGE
jgi:CheY-like chemotaxis protein